MLVLCPRVPAPQEVLDEAAGDVGGHIVAIIPAVKLQVGDVTGIEEQTQEGPRTQDGAAARGAGAVEAEVVDDGVVEAVQDVEPRAQVIELLGDLKIARVEDAAERPAHDAHPGERDVKRL